MPLSKYLVGMAKKNLVYQFVDGLTARNWGTEQADCNFHPNKHEK